MAVRKVFGMQNKIFQRNKKKEGICTAASLQWAKICLTFKRGIGSYNQLQLSDHQINALMHIIREFDTNPVRQTTGMGLKLVGNGDHDILDVEGLHKIISENAPHTGIFWNSFHTMGYRIGQAGNRKEYEWFDNNHGLYLSNDSGELLQFMKGYMGSNYGENPCGVRIVSL